MIQLRAPLVGNYSLAAIIGIVLMMGVFASLYMTRDVLAFGGQGTGTSEDPYQISDCEQLSDMRNDTAGNYILINNIDCSDTVNWNDGAGFLPVGNLDSVFSGTLDGKNYTISNLFMDHPVYYARRVYGVGLFGLFGASPTVIKNIYFANAHINGRGPVGILAGYTYNTTISNVRTDASSKVTGSANVGGLVGLAMYTTITDSASLGNVGDITGGGGSSVVGGIVASMYASSIATSYSTGSIEGWRSVGGIVGQLSDSRLKNVYASGSVTGSSNVGGLIGYIQDGTYMPEVRNSYSSASVTASDSISEAGGLIGMAGALEDDDPNDDMAIENNFVIGSVNGFDNTGGILGWSDGSLASFATNYFDISATGQTSCAGDSSNNCAGMNDSSQAPNYFKDVTNPPLNTWDFANVWQLTSGGLPQLRMAVAPQPFAPVVTSDSSGEIPTTGMPLTSQTTQVGASNQTLPEIAVPNPMLPGDITSVDATKERDSSNAVTHISNSSDEIKKTKTASTNGLLWVIGLSSIVLISIAYFIYRRIHNN